MSEHRVEAQAGQTRDEFLTATLPLLINDCVHVKDHDSWCQNHDSLWMPGNEHCARFTDMDSFADSVIEAWEGRPDAVNAAAVRAALAFKQGLIEDLSGDVQRLEEERDG